MSRWGIKYFRTWGRGRILLTSLNVKIVLNDVNLSLYNYYLEFLVDNNLDPKHKPMMIEIMCFLTKKVICKCTTIHIITDYMY